MLALAETLRPVAVTLVPERREEVTTEGGLDVVRAASHLGAAIARLKRAGVRTSLFIDPEAAAVRAAHALGTDAVELHTGQYAHAPADPRTLRALADAAALASSLGMAVHAGHGLSVHNVGPVAAIPEIEELNIGHAIVGRAIFVGLAGAVREIRQAMDDAREADRF
jgi:pyridoxine 5-phosphate synthase